MNSWIEAMAIEFEHAGRRERAASLPSRRGIRSNRRKLALAACTLVLLVPATVVANSIWNDSPSEPAPGAGLTADFDESIATPNGAGPGSEPTVTSPGTCEFLRAEPRFAEGAAPASLVADIAAIRNVGARFAGPKDLVPGREIFPANSRTVDLNVGGSFYLTAVAPGGAPHVPDTADCERFKNMPGRPAEICITELGPNGGQTCQTASGVAAGRAFVVEDRVLGGRRGEAQIFGIAPDGVASVRLTFHPKTNLRPVSVAVENNVWSHAYNGSAAVPPEVEFVR